MKAHLNRFTIIELLIVISIIAILASILLPALNAAKDKAQSISCTNNMKQIGLAFHHYTSSWDDYFPPAEFNPNSSPQLYWTLAFAIDRLLPLNTVRCPARDRWDWAGLLEQAENGATSSRSRFFYAHYGYNKAFLGYSGAQAKTTKIRRPTAMVLAAESVPQTAGYRTGTRMGCYYVNYYYSAPGNGPTAFPFHARSTTCNVIWVDGHISSVRGSGSGEIASESMQKAVDSPLYGKYINFASSGNSRDSDFGFAWDRH